MNEKLVKIGELLPDTLSEETLNKINELIASFITDEVASRMKLLEAKSVAFMRNSMDAIKSQALSELNEENETFKDALQFRKLKSLMGVKTVEVSESKDIKELQDENKLLIEHINTLAEEHTKYKKLYKKYKKSAQELTEQVGAVNEENTNLKDEKKPFKSSEKALMLAEEITPGVTNSGGNSGVQNSFLSEDVLALMPKTSKKK